MINYLSFLPIIYPFQIYYLIIKFIYYLNFLIILFHYKGLNYFIFKFNILHNIPLNSLEMTKTFHDIQNFLLYL